MLRNFLFIFLLPTAPAFGQLATPAPDLKKANPRPAVETKARDEMPAQPFDKADAKTMAGMCVALDTEAGEIDIELYPESAPETVRNFLNLTATGAFDTTVFSRVVPGFVIQGGALSTSQKPTPLLSRQSRHNIPDEPNAILHERGVVSMARSDEPNSASTHFFILLTPAPDLDHKFAAFGRVTKGMDVVQAINEASVVNEKPEKPVQIKKATVAKCAPAS
jgi:peptidyl-prolyl cis-trans isomerase B (cyclophilin B)